MSVLPHCRNRLNHLDDPETYRRLDPSNFFRRLRDLPSQFPRVEKAVAELELSNQLSSVRRVLVIGMGGSAIGGELLADVAAHEGFVPVTIWRDYDLPAWVDDSTLILVCSHSGRTKESLSGFRRAVDLKLPTVVLTGGATLAAEARRAGHAVVLFDYQGEPRSGIGYSFLGPLILLQRLCLLPAVTNQLVEMQDEVHSLIAQIGDEVPAEANEAKRLAVKMHGKLSVIYGGGFLGGVARRWKTQINENAKSWALVETLPEAYHNTVEGKLPASLSLGVHAVLLSSDNHERLSQHHAITELLAERNVDFSIVCGRGSSVLSQIMTNVLLGDYASCYLALLNGIDPSPVHTIDAMRQRRA